MRRRVAALVIGNSDYDHTKNLKNPSNDANDIGDKFVSYGFDTLKLVNVTHEEMDAGLEQFIDRLEEAEIGIFFFAGHGMQVKGENYLAATNTKVSSETSAKHSSLALNRIIETMEEASTATSIIILDACRDNPWEKRFRRADDARGLAPVYAPKGTLIAFATSPGEYASDGSGRNGAYTEALLQNIETENCSIETMFKMVRNTLAALTDNKQTSWEHTSLSSEFYFNLGIKSSVKIYKEEALADELFVLDPALRSHKLIRTLKSHDFYIQNPAINELSVEVLNGCNKTSLFLIGRNICQAAHGGAWSAESYIKNFVDRTEGLDPNKIKPLLDGLLFETFFNKKAQLRASPKSGVFNDIFELQKFPHLKSSFDFIAEALIGAGGLYLSIPGKSQRLSVDIKLATHRSKEVVSNIFINSIDVADFDPEYVTNGTVDYGFAYTQNLEEFETWLSEQLIVPKRLMTIKYSPQNIGRDKVGISYGLRVKMR